MDTKQPKIYFDYTAGRGSYDDKYIQEESNASSTEIIINKQDEPETHSQSNVYRATFEKFLENRPQQLKKQDFTPYKEYRRHSYNKGPQQKYSGRNYSYQSQNEGSYENNRYYANKINQNPRADFKPTNEKYNQKSNNNAFNWSPTRIANKQ